MLLSCSLIAQDNSNDSWVNHSSNTSISTGNCFLGKVGLLTPNPEMNLHINTIIPSITQQGAPAYPLQTDRAGIRFEFSQSPKAYSSSNFCASPLSTLEKWDIGINRGKFYIEKINTASNPAAGASRFLQIDNNGTTTFDTHIGTALLLKRGGGYSNTRASIGISSYQGIQGLRFTMSSDNGNSFVDALHIGNDGRIGMGTTKLASNAQLSVKGLIYAEEIMVKLYSNWPDYVFAKEYQLRSLSEVEAYITKHHHLPEIPSAQEVENNGVELGEMNALLLRKVEELTLYVIELEKKVNALNK